MSGILGFVGVTITQLVRMDSRHGSFRVACMRRVLVGRRWKRKRNQTEVAGPERPRSDIRDGDGDAHRSNMLLLYIMHHDLANVRYL
jgi:hypothetical protein